MTDNNNSTEDGIPEIYPERIFAEWKLGKSPAQISQEMRIEITIVMRVLKEKQKSIVKKGS